MIIHDSPVARKTIGCAIEVHKTLGPGLLESVYEQCLARELAAAGLTFQRQRRLPLRYRDLELDAACRVDFVIDGILLIEVKSVEQLLSVHTAQVLTYLKLLDLHDGLLINFNVPLLVQGIRSIVR